MRAFRLAPFVGHSLYVEVAIHAPRLARVEALEASFPQEAPPPSSLIPGSELNRAFDRVRGPPAPRLSSSDLGRSPRTPPALRVRR
jgi:hypothetical protein